MNSDLHAISIYSPAAGSTRVRIYDWLTHLKMAAVEHQYAGLSVAAPSMLVRNLTQVVQAEHHIRSLNLSGKTALMSREASPFSRGDVEVSLLRSASRGVYDFDDALFNDDSLRRQILGGARKFERAVSAADCVIAGNEYLADWASNFQREVVIIPSCVEPEHYLPARTTDHGLPPRLVWLGSRSTEQFIIPLMDDLLELNHTRGLRLTLISSPQENDALVRLEPMMDRVPWRVDTFAAHLANADVALAPLADTPFARGKCAYKILQYGAAGLRIVGSPVGANRIALDRLGGLSVDINGDWAEAIASLLDESTEVTRKRQSATRAAVAEHYSFSAWSGKWCSVLGIDR